MAASTTVPNCGRASAFFFASLFFHFFPPLFLQTQETYKHKNTGYVTCDLEKDYTHVGHRWTMVDLGKMLCPNQIASQVYTNNKSQQIKFFMYYV